MLSKDSNNNSDIIEGGEKIVVIGDASVGKSSMILRYINNTYSENVKPTIGCDHYEKEVPVGNNKVKLSIWDTAGQERFRGLSSSYYKKARCVVIVYDITRKFSFEKIDFWREEIVNFAENDIIVVLVGTKVDLNDKRLVLQDEAVKYSDKYKFSYYTEVSSVENSNNGIELLFTKIAELVLEKLQTEGNSRTHKINDKSNGEHIEVQLKEGEVAGEDNGCKC